MVEEKLIHWRNIQSPLLYDVGRHVEGPRKYWDIIVKEVGEDGGPLDRVRVFLEAKGIDKSEYELVRDLPKFPGGKPHPSGTLGIILSPGAPLGETTITCDVSEIDLTVPR